MKDTAEQSAQLKQALKHQPVTAELLAEATEHIAEASEAVWEVEEGYDTCIPGSYVANEILTSLGVEALL